MVPKPLTSGRHAKGRPQGQRLLQQVERSWREEWLRMPSQLQNFSNAIPLNILHGSVSVSVSLIINMGGKESKYTSMEDIVFVLLMEELYLFSFCCWLIPNCGNKSLCDNFSSTLMFCFSQFGLCNSFIHYQVTVSPLIFVANYFHNFYTSSFFADF